MSYFPIQDDIGGTDEVSICICILLFVNTCTICMCSQSLHQPVEDEDPLNSDDDVDDDDVSEQKDFETNDTIVCLWEKVGTIDALLPQILGVVLQVYRVRTKWKFLLKDGIMHLGGFDYVFQKGTGEADW